MAFLLILITLVIGRASAQCMCDCPCETTTNATITVDPDKTTTVEPTTTPDGGWSGNCSKEITSYAGMKEYWLSPRYDGVTNYPQGDYCCSLNITIPTKYNMFMVIMEMQSPSMIYESNSCAYDNIEYTPAEGEPTKICGEMSRQSWTELAVFPTAPMKFSFTWCSSRADKATAIGFKMEITGKDLMASGK